MISAQHLPDGAIGSGQAIHEPSASRIVLKPVPSSQTKDPRKYQIDQLRKRFSPRESTFHDGTTGLRFHLKPSDPDFPFELDHLECDLQVPAAYPSQPPTLKVKNQDIPRGFSINIENGWNRLVLEKKDATLLSLTHALDKNLEAFLSEQKADTVKLVTFKDTRHLEVTASKLGGSMSEIDRPKPAPVQVPSRTYIPEESYSKDQIAEAKARRAQETRQLEARMGRLALYQKSADGIVYTLPIEPKRRSILPSGLRPVTSVQLIIPLLYPLQPLRILLNDVESEAAEGVEEKFMRRTVQQSQLSLMSHMNWLAQNLHILAEEAEKERQAQIEASKAAPAALESQKEKGKASASINTSGGDRSHIQVIPRPPEWTFIHDSEEEDGSDADYSWSEDDSDGGGVIVDAAKAGTNSTQQPERGTAISFPAIELHGIELFQVSILSLNVKCERCRTINEVIGLRPDIEKASSCKKCATPFAVKFRREMVHQNSVRAGFIDISGCTVADMLPSTFVPICSKCSTPSQGLVSVRGEATTNVCRECHGKFTFKMPEVKFLRITPGQSIAPTSGPRRRQENLGLHAGEPLPNRGTCEHYKRSYRWFRFSCCSKVHACDKCHDDAEDHINEWANRMICGWCSREQNYAVEACGFCGRSVIGKKGRGFWEGGKGTRDKRMMSRKDPRKYKRTGGGEARKKE